MKRLMGLKILGVLFFLYAITGFFGVPYAITHLVPTKVSEATQGGKFALEQASFNPFTFRLTVKKFSFKTPQNKNLIAVKLLTVNLNPLDYLWKGGWVIDSVLIDAPQISLSKDAKGEMNFDWLLGEDQNETGEPSEPLALLIHDFTLKNGAVEYTDVSEGKNYHEHVNAIGFHVENIDLRETSNSKGRMRLYATINEGGFVDLRGKIGSMKPFALAGSVAFNSGKLYTPWRYFKEKLPIEVADGTADLSLEYELSTDDINATKLSNVQMGLKSLRIISKGEERKLLNVGSVALADATVWPMRKRFEAKGIHVNGMDVAVSRGREGNIDWVQYIDEINQAFPEDENETKIPWNYALDTVSVKHINIAWSDDAPLSPYDVSVKNGLIEAASVTSEETKPLSVMLGLGETVFARKSDKSVAVGWEGISVEGISLDRANRFANIATVQIRAPHLSLARTKEGRLDFERYMYQRKVIKAVESTPWGYAFGEIALGDGKIDFVDEVPSKPVALHLDQLGITLSNLTDNPNDKNLFDLSGRLNATSSIQAQGEVIRAEPSSRGSFKIREMDAALFDPYGEPFTHASLKRANVSASGEYRYTPASSSVKGKVALKDWVVNDSRDDTVLVAWHEIGATPFTYTYPMNRLIINRLDVKGLYTNTMISPAKVLNFSTLSKTKETNATDTTAKKSDHPFGVDIVKLNIYNGSTDFSDLSLPLPFKTHIHDLNGHVIGISTTTESTTFVKLEGEVDAYGLAQIGGKLNTASPKEYTDIKVKFENLELKNYTPYSLEFLGYKIADGKLYLNLGYHIDKGSLKGENKVVIKQIVLGEEKAGGSPWPMRLVVALLEDSEGVIDVDLPVEGDVNDPKFRYGKVIWQVITNLLTKAVTSPFRLLGSLMGLDGEDDTLSKVSFEAGKSAILPPEREKLDKLSRVLASRPKLHLSVHGGWDMQADTRALQIQKLIDTVIGQHKEASANEALTLTYLEDLAEKSIKRDELEALRDTLYKKYPTKEAYSRYYSETLIEKLIALQVIAPPELSGLAHRRADVIVEYLGQNPALKGRVSAGESEKSGMDKEERVETRLELGVL